MAKFRFELTVMHPGGGYNDKRTIIAEENHFGDGVYHFHNKREDGTLETVACFPINYTIVESETEIVEEVATNGTSTKINHNEQQY